MASLYVATPCYGCKMTADFAACLLQLHGQCMRRGISMTTQLLGNESLIPRARNIMIEEFFMSGAEFMLFLDADLAFSPAAVLDRLLPFAVARPDAVVTGVYPKKHHDFTRLDATSTEPLRMQALDWNINIAGGTTQVHDGFAEVLDSATGCMLIPRGVVARMKEAYPELTCVNDINPGRHPVKEYVAMMDCMIDPDTRRFLSEDYAFSRRFQQIGGKIFADLASPMCHIGTVTYEGDLRARFVMTLAE